MEQHVEVCHFLRPATTLLHFEAGRQLDLVGCLEWYLRFVVVLEWQIESYAAGDGLVKTLFSDGMGHF
jgi:hypothetical protein